MIFSYDFGDSWEVKIKQVTEFEHCDLPGKEPQGLSQAKDTE